MNPTTRLDFIKQYTPLARKLTKGTGIFPETLLTQAILESSGSYNLKDWLVGGSKLSQVANNFFGIKASKQWKGATYNIDTKEQTPAGKTYILANSTFRAYSNIEDSMADYIKFLKSNKRYTTGGVFAADTVEAQFQALKDSGYATSTSYVKTLTDVYHSLKKTIESIPLVPTIGLGTIALVGLGLFFLSKKTKSRKLAVVS